MKKIIILLFVLAAVGQIFGQTFVVSTDPNTPNAYDSISEALTAIYQTSNEHSTILLLPGTYDLNGSINWQPINYPPYDQWHITIRGWNQDTVIIDFNGNHSFDLSASDLDQRDSIENLTIINGKPAIKITAGNPLVKGVKIVDSYNYSYGGGGITLKSSGTIEDCIIDNCTISTANLNENFGGGIYVENNTTLPVTISGTEIMNCSAKEGGAIYCTGTGDFTITDNYIHDNTNILVNGSLQCDYSAILVENVGDMDFSYNVVAENVGYYTYKMVLGFFNCNSLGFHDNTIIDNPYQMCLKEGGNSSAEIYNNIFANSDKGVYHWYGTTPTFTYNLTNCDVQNYLNITPGTGCLTNVDPLLDAYYVPLWDATDISPCIDAGSPAFQDPDGSISDIGAKRAITHRVDNLVIYDNATTVTEWKWISFPTLDNIHTASEPNKITNLLSGITNISEIQYNDGASTLYYNNGTWSNPNFVFNRTDGYKFKVNPQSNDVNLEISGFQRSEYDYYYLNQGVNWISYSLDIEQSWQDAFDGYLDNITSIKTTNGTASEYGGAWVSNGKFKLSYGDMVVVTASRSFNFRWNNEIHRSERGEDEVNPLPETASIRNYPNPFNPTTTISYSLPVSGIVNIDIYNVKGQKVKQLVSGNKEAGKHTQTWNGVDDKGNPVGSGIYFYQLKTVESTLKGKMMLLK